MDEVSRAGLYRELGEHSARLEEISSRLDAFRQDLQALPKILWELREIKTGACSFGNAYAKRITVLEDTFKSYRPIIDDAKNFKKYAKTLDEVNAFKEKGRFVLTTFGALLILMGLLSTEVASWIGEVLTRVRAFMGMVNT